MFVGTLLPWIIVIIASLHAKKNQSPEDFTSQITSADDGDQTEESESDKIVIFIVDASDQWKVKKTSQNLLDSVMEKLKYSNDKVKFAVVYVSEKSARLFDFRKITDLTVVNETLNGDQYKTLASAKELVDLTLSWNECKPKLEGEIAEQCAMTIISDGESEFFNNENVFTQWKDAGNRILIVGIGGKATGPAFTTLASKPKDLLLVQSSSKLLAVQNKLIERLEVIEDDDEEEDYDEDEQLVIYLVDSKEDLGKEELKSQRKLLMSIMTVQKEDNAKVKFAVVDVLHNSARLFDFRDQSDLKEIEKMLKKDDYAVLSNAKELIDYTMDWKECNPKRKKKCVMAIVSDGKSQFYQKVEDFSKWKNSGHKIVVVGIGNNFKKSKLAVLATEEDDLILVQSHDKLGTIVRELNHRIDEQHSKTRNEDSRSSESGGKGTSNSGQRSETSGEDSRSSESGGNGTSNSGNGPSVEAKEQVQIFILDATKNTENVDLKSQIKFITQVIKKLKENNKEVKFAVAFVFENSAKFFDLRNFTSLTRLDKILKGDKYVSVSNLVELIKITMTWEQCREKNNEETSNQCVMTIISDGQSKFFENGDEVTEWKDIENGIVVIVVGKDGKNNSIADLASSPDNAIFIESPDELETIKSQLLEKLDDENSPKKHEENVETKIVIFVTDSSKKKLLRDSDIEIIFLISAMKKLQKKNDKIRFAVVNVMGSSAGLFDLRNQTDILVIEKILKKNDYIAASSLKKLLHLIMSWEECRPKKNEKTSAQCTITFISNGKAEFLDDVEEFSKWKESGNKIVIVGIGKEFPNTAISSLASTEDDLIHVQSPYELPTVENDLIEILEKPEQTEDKVLIFVSDISASYVDFKEHNKRLIQIMKKSKSVNDKVKFAVAYVEESSARLFDFRNQNDLSVIYTMMKGNKYTKVKDASKLIEITLSWKECRPKENEKISGQCVMTLIIGKNSEFFNVEEFSKWKDSGNRIVAVGVGKKVSASLIEDLASTPEDIFILQSPDELTTHESKLVERLEAKIHSEETQEQVHIFILDATQNTEGLNLNAQFNFMTNIMEKQRETNDKITYAVVVVSESKARLFDIRNVTDYTEVNKILTRGKYVSLSNLAELIKITMTWEQCREKKNQESFNQCVMIIISGGKSIFFENGDKVTEWKEIGNGIVVIVVGKDGKNNSIADLASSPDNIILIESPDELETIESQLLEKLDGMRPSVETKEQVQIFILDATKNTESVDLKSQIKFVTEVIKKLKEDNKDVKFAVAPVFENSAKLFDLRNLTSLARLDKILKVDKYVSVSNLAELIKITMAWEQCREKKNDETSNQCVMTIISDGKSNFFENGDEVTEWKEIGNGIVVIGVGEDVKDNSMVDLASSPDNVIIIQSPDDLSTVFNKLIGRLEANDNKQEETNVKYVVFIIDASNFTLNVDLNTLRFIIELMDEDKYAKEKIKFLIAVVTGKSAIMLDLQKASKLDSVYKLSKQDEYISIKNVKELVDSIMLKGHCQKRNDTQISDPCVMTIISNGTAPFYDNVKEISAWKEAGIKVFVVGLGDADLSESWHSSPGDLLQLESSVWLPNFESYIRQKIFAGSSDRVNVCPSKTKMDIIFLLDTSLAPCIDLDGQIHFLRDITKRFPLGSKGTHFGAVTYSFKAHKAIKLGKYSDNEKLLTTLKELKRYNTFSYTHKALEAIIDKDLFGTRNGGRSDAQDVIVWITNGHASVSRETLKLISALKKKKVKIVTVGFGTGVRLDKLLLASSEPEDFVWTENFDDLRYTGDAVARRLCHVNG